MNWLFVLGALLLLWIPGDLLLSQRTRLRTFRQVGSKQFDRHRRPWWWLPVYLIDPVRGAAGAWLLVHAWTPDPELRDFARHYPLLLTFVIGWIGLMLQMRTKRENDALLAPIAFLAGMLVSLLAWPVNVLVVVLALATMVAARAWGAFFVQAAAAAGVLGYLMKEPKQTLVVTMVLLGWPLLYALMFRRRLTLPARH